MMERAIRDRWNLTPEVRERVISTLLAVMASPNAPPTSRVAACRVLVAADAVDARREANDTREDHAQRADQVARVRAALQTPEGRAALLALGEKLFDEPPGEHRPAQTEEMSQGAREVSISEKISVNSGDLEDVKGS